MSDRLHAFSDDVLAEHDAVAIAELVRTGRLGAEEVARAAIERAARVTGLNGVVHDVYDNPRFGDPAAPLYGVPTFVKDNTDVAGLPTNHGTDAYVARPAKADGPYARQFMATGVTVLGKSALPEYGLNASSEFMTREPVRNPWHLEYSIGASSGGATDRARAGPGTPEASDRHGRRERDGRAHLPADQGRARAHRESARAARAHHRAGLAAGRRAVRPGFRAVLRLPGDDRVEHRQAQGPSLRPPEAGRADAGLACPRPAQPPARAGHAAPPRPGRGPLRPDVH